MVRTFLCSVAVLAFMAGSILADDNKNTNTQKDQNKSATAKGDHQKSQARITNVDPKNGTITVHLKDKNGKDVDKTFRLTEDVRMIDDTGRVAALDVFQSGNDVLIIEADGRLREVHKQRAGANTNSTPNKNSNDKR